MEVPAYQEISVKNMYADALKDDLLIEVPAIKGATLGEAARARVLLRYIVHFEEPVHEGHHC